MSWLIVGPLIFIWSAVVAHKEHMRLHPEVPEYHICIWNDVDGWPVYCEKPVASARALKFCGKWENTLEYKECLVDVDATE